MTATEEAQLAVQFALSQAGKALQRGQKREARRWAEQAAALAPHREEPWLILAAVASPKASIAYLQEALRINPQSLRARKGMDWALQRLNTQAEMRPPSAPLRASPVPPPPRRNIRVAGGTPADQVRPRSVILPGFAAVLFVILLAAIWFSTPTLSQAFAAPQMAAVAMAELATPSPSATPLPTETPQPTQTPAPTSTPLPTTTALPTETPSPPPTDTPEPTPTEEPTEAPPLVALPEGVGSDEHWIDVDLGNQLTSAYDGTDLVATFVVSTGTWQTPTVTGVYRVYVKYRYADMSGPGYYLANVPYVMYFYQGYGIHGTYWHNNFGTPMSHGCVNLTIDDAGWMFDFADVGTVVNVHN